MSVLLVHPPETLGRAVVQRLISQGDDVAAIVEDDASGHELKALGVYLAPGAADDADLIERAAQPARSIVIFDDRAAVVEAAVEGAARLPESARLILCAPDPAPRTVSLLRASGADFVVLRTGRKIRRFRTQGRPTDDQIAGAIDAADDLAGDVRADLDLTTGEDWQALRLESPWEG